VNGKQIWSGNLTDRCTVTGCVNSLTLPPLEQSVFTTGLNSYGSYVSGTSISDPSHQISFSVSQYAGNNMGAAARFSPDSTLVYVYVRQWYLQAYNISSPNITWQYGFENAAQMWGSDDFYVSPTDGDIFLPLRRFQPNNDLILMSFDGKSGALNWVISFNFTSGYPGVIAIGPGADKDGGDLIFWFVPLVDQPSMLFVIGSRTRNIKFTQEIPNVGSNYYTQITVDANNVVYLLLEKGILYAIPTI